MYPVTSRGRTPLQRHVPAAVMTALGSLLAVDAELLLLPDIPCAGRGMGYDDCSFCINGINSIEISVSSLCAMLSDHVSRSAL